MRRPKSQWRERVLRAGRRLWGIDDQWDIQIRFVPLCIVEGSPTSSTIEWDALTQKIATIEIQLKEIQDEEMFCLYIWHELGHLVLGGLWRVAQSWIDQKGVYPYGTRARGALNDTWNDVENITIDQILYQAFHARERWREILQELG